MPIAVLCAVEEFRYILNKNSCQFDKTPTEFQKSEGGQKVKIEPKGTRRRRPLYYYPSRHKKGCVVRFLRPEEKYIVYTVQTIEGQARGQWWSHREHVAKRSALL